MEKRFSLQFFASILMLTMLVFCQSCSRFPRYLLPPAEATKARGIYHIVKKQETLWHICKTYNVSLQDVAELNNIKDVNQIRVGDRIFIPGAKKTKPVAATETPKEKAPPPKIIKSTGLFSWPVNGKVIEEYGIYGGLKHDGISIQASEGTPVKAADSGKVAFSANLEGYGNTIIVEHKGGYATIYANNKVNLVKQGDMVKKGQHIADVGGSLKNSPVSALHFQIRKGNQPRNPLFYLLHR